MIRKFVPYLVFIFLFLIPLSPALAENTWNVIKYGAKGDGKTVDTKAIQTAIDNCFVAGGGTVYIPNGKFLSGMIHIKDNVTLFIESGSTLIACDIPEEYALKDLSSDKEGNSKSLIYAEGANNIAVTGSGTLEGQGDKLMENGIRPHLIHFKSCNGVKVKDLKLQNGSNWISKYEMCRNVTIDGISINSRENPDIEKPRYYRVHGRNTDGIDIVDCSVVNVSNCNIVSGDDGIVFKSFSRKYGCRNITVSNCNISTNASGIKIGTESSGDFTDIVISNCTVYDTRNDGIGIMSVDGSNISRVIVSGITMRNLKGTAIFVRIGNRGRDYGQTQNSKTGSLSNILIKDIYGTKTGSYGCSVTGIPGGKINNVRMENINLEFNGGEEILYVDNDLKNKVPLREIGDVPENEDAYPRGVMFGKLPAYGFYIRHAENIDLINLNLSFIDLDKRPALVADDIRAMHIDNFHAAATSQTPSLLHLNNAREVNIGNSGSLDRVPVFLKVTGNLTNEIRLVNLSDNADLNVFVTDQALSRKIKEINN